MRRDQDVVEALPAGARLEREHRPVRQDAVHGEPVAPEVVAGGVEDVFNPTGDDFRRNRLAMDGILPDGTVLAFEPRSRGQGFNHVLVTTHRQNFLVPPRRHRSFPLAELR